MHIGCLCADRLDGDRLHADQLQLAKRTPPGWRGTLRPTRGKVSKDTEEAGLCCHAVTRCTEGGGSCGC